ncbi:MAG: hypothetical protein ABIQ27_02790 [Flavobacterium sp.]|uniref:hypothetical protein n=1 Tax=Flavobacterium sp. TaxID=239 RepID=UPI0032639536
MKLAKPLVVLLLIAALFSCKQEEKKVAIPKKTVKPMVKKEKQLAQIQYPEKELIAFMDSVAKLSSKSLQDKVSFRTDSIFKNMEKINKKLSSSEFQQLKLAIKNKQIDIKFAERIFEKFPFDSTEVEEGKILITLFSFDKNKTDYNEFAICLGYLGLSWTSDAYFFKTKKLISKHHIYHRYGLELEHYKDLDGKTIVYYKENYESGSGIWWFNYYFYKYEGDRLIPILNELQNANMTWPGNRTLWLKSTIVSTNPLTLKMVYRQQPFSPNIDRETLWIINDSTLVKYKWNEKTKMLEGDYAHSKINKTQILTYYLEENELLFINTYHQLLRKELDNPAQREAILYYLFDVKHNH